MNKEEFIRIAGKVSDGSADEQELSNFNRYYQQYQQEHNVWENLAQKEKDELQNLLSKRIHQQLKLQNKSHSRKLWPRFAAAAAVLLVLSFGLYFHQFQQLPKQGVSQKSNDLLPGGNKAYLTLANGERINLNDAQNIDLSKQDGISITKTADGQLIYQVNAASNIDTGFNTIETPLGGQYQVRLPDGTNVWLNSSSSLRYPLQFKGNKRIVQIKGEAYFEVAHNAKMPFVVRSVKQDIEVLGTHFNVMAYADEPEVQTTLLQGSVKVTTAKNELILKPGQQAKVESSSALLQTNVDVESAIAWKMGKIQFADMDIQHIMRMLSRWYDFEVTYQGKPLGNTYGASFSRTKNLSVVLKLLESTGDVHFKIEGRRITVMP